MVLEARGRGETDTGVEAGEGAAAGRQIFLRQI